MKRLFPKMYDEPEKGMHFALLAYWIIGFEVVPTFMPMLADGLWDNLGVTSWMEIIYHCINGLVILWVLKEYFRDSFYQVQQDPKKFLLTVGVAAFSMVALAGVLYICLGVVVADLYPLSEKMVALTNGLLVRQQPLFGTICCSFFVPFAVVGMFYVTCFAPGCRRNRWLGYVVLPLVMAIPWVLDILWRGDTEIMIAIFLAQLPVHLVACWTYQKLDTVWAPIATLAVFNFATSLLALI